MGSNPVVDLNCASRHFSFRQIGFERGVFEEPAAVFRLKIWRVCYCSIVSYTVDVICSFFSLMTWKDSGNELLSIFCTQENTAPLVFGLYFFKNTSKRHHSPNLVLSSHALHTQIPQCLLFTSCKLFPSIRFHQRDIRG